MDYSCNPFVWTRLDCTFSCDFYMDRLHSPLAFLRPIAGHLLLQLDREYKSKPTPLLLLSLGLSPYLVGRNLPLYVVPPVRGVTQASQAHSRSLADRPGRQVLQGVVLGSQGTLRAALLLLYIGAIRVSVFHLPPCMLCTEDCRLYLKLP
ncbi:jg22474 [Pararge aegeria aegeria]|uniref:Jg22474 protein n=1 Tax=Pararge aegeria aegeria TaxID=348720 RepID=A0A8S4SBE1_9NEOP|nr:jg22474 [Pararge aegeria aegeria]